MSRGSSKVPVARQPAAGQAFSLDDTAAIPAKLLRPGRWYYATPVSPAPSPSSSDQALYDPRNKPFQNGWANAALADGISYSPLRYRLKANGRGQIQGAIDGGALGTVCVTLPSQLWPEETVTDVISSVDGTRSMTVKISATNGDVTVIGFPQGSVVLSDNQVTTSTIADGAVTEAKIGLADVTTDDVSSAKHGFAPKSPADATKFLNGAATPAYAQVKDSDLSTSDITTNDVSTTKHGFAPKAPNDTSKFLRGDGTWAVAGGVTSVVASDAIWDVKGDLAVGTGADTASRLAVGSNGQVLTADSTQSTGVKWASGGITEYDYVEATSPVTVSSTSEGSGTTIVSGTAVSYDGSTRICISFSCPYVSIAATTAQNVVINVYDGATAIARIVNIQYNDSGSNALFVPVHREYFITPTNGSHTYSIRAWKTAAGATVSIGAGASGATAYTPAFMRITKA